MLNQDTTSVGDVNQADFTGRLALFRGKGVDEDPNKDSDRDKMGRADLDASRTGRAVMRLQAMPNGEYPIRNAAELKAVIREWQTGLKTDRYSGFEIQRHIIRRARDLKMVALLPSEWGVNLEIMQSGMDDDFLKTIQQLEAESRFFSAAQRRKYASTGIALKDGSFPIPDKDALRRAIRLVGKGGATAKRHIIKRAKALGAASKLPDSWNVAAEEKEEESNQLMAEEFQSFLLAEGKTVPYPQIIQEATAENNQTMRVRVPFYIGDTITNAPGIDKKILFPTAILQEVVQEGKNDIAAKTQPLTVYARHAHAADSSYLPIGGVVDLMAEGSVGYAVLDIEPTTYGKDVQVLLRANPPKLNATSLRSGKGRFELENVQVNGESMFRVRKLGISGIDFAPDSPAMKNYGIEILQEGAKVIPIKAKEENNNNVEKLTLEMVKEHPEIVSEIEKPVIDRLDQEVQKNADLIKKNSELESKVARFEVAEYAREIAAKHPKPEEALVILLEVAETCKSKEEFATKTYPILLEALSTKPKTIVEKKKTPEDKLRELFGNNGQTRETTDEEISQEDEIAGERVGPMEVPA